MWVLLARLPALGGISILLSGCIIPVAPFFDEPFPNDQLTQLKAGEAASFAQADSKRHIVDVNSNSRIKD